MFRHCIIYINLRSPIGNHVLFSYRSKFWNICSDYLSNVGALSHVAEEEDSQPGPHSLVPPSQLEDESSHPELEHRQRQSAALNRVPLHVFATDVYYLGRMIQKQFIDVSFTFIFHPTRYHNHLQGNRGYKFMKPLIENMIQEDGTLRLSMVGVRARFHKICRRLQRKKLHTRIKKRRSVELFQPLRYSRGWVWELWVLAKEWVNTWVLTWFGSGWWQCCRI